MLGNQKIHLGPLVGQLTFLSWIRLTAEEAEREVRQLLRKGKKKLSSGRPSNFQDPITINSDSPMAFLDEA